MRQQGNEIAIELTDDGAGLDLGRIREKARAQGLINESEAAQLAAFKGANPEVLRKLAELSSVTCRADDRQSCVRFIESDTAFHATVARLSRNQMLIQAVHEARSQMERIMFAAIDIDYYGEAPSREHREILKAIQDRNPERARQRMYEHIVQSKDKVLGLTGFAGPSR